MTIMPNPFVDEDHRFILDEKAFMEAISDVPIFLGDPSPEFRAAEIEPLLKTLFQGIRS